MKRLYAYVAAIVVGFAFIAADLGNLLLSHRGPLLIAGAVLMAGGMIASAIHAASGPRE